jgi:hypothetical protein
MPLRAYIDNHEIVSIGVTLKIDKIANADKSEKTFKLT